MEPCCYFCNENFHLSLVSRASAKPFIAEMKQQEQCFFLAFFMLTEKTAILYNFIRKQYTNLLTSFYSLILCRCNIISFNGTSTFVRLCCYIGACSVAFCDRYNNETKSLRVWPSAVSHAYTIDSQYTI